MYKPNNNQTNKWYFCFSPGSVVANYQAQFEETEGLTGPNIENAIKGAAATGNFGEFTIDENSVSNNSKHSLK